jgi:hypothetical protein
MATLEQVMLDDLSNQIASLTADRSGWRARALLAEKQLEELAQAAQDESSGDDLDTEVKTSA